MLNGMIPISINQIVRHSPTTILKSHTMELSLLIHIFELPVHIIKKKSVGNHKWNRRIWFFQEKSDIILPLSLVQKCVIRLTMLFIRCIKLDFGFQASLKNGHIFYPLRWGTSYAVSEISTNARRRNSLAFASLSKTIESVEGRTRYCVINLTWINLGEYTFTIPSKTRALQNETE